MFDEKFWLALAFIGFVILIARYVFPLITDQLDAKIKQIAEELVAAKEAKEKAKKLLLNAEDRYQAAIEFSDKLIQDAAIEAQKLLIEVQKAAEIEVAKKMDALNARIKNEEERAIREIKVGIINAAIKNIETNLQNNDSTRANSLIKKAAADVGKLVH
jgi:F-type H+-transporting ATPase subunit b